MTQDTRPGIPHLMLVGIAAGLLSGLFGVGGGTIIVPALVIWLSMQQRLSAGTSVAAILPTAIVGATSYAVQGNVDWIAAACLAGGIIIGAQVGSHLLARVPTGALQWGFLAFLVVVIVGLWLVVPQREDVIHITVFSGIMLGLTGFITGIISGLVGVGGGVVVVPVLMFFFGASDLVAKGTSLLMMIPGSISGTIGNIRRGNIDMRAAVTIGLSASASVPFGTIIAAWIDPFWGNVAFSLYLTFVLVQMLVKKLKSDRGRK